MYCPRCDAQIQADDVHLGTLVARCRRCNEVFRFADQLGPPAEGAMIERRVAKPDRLLVKDNCDALQMSFAWTKASSPQARAADWTVLLSFIFILAPIGWFLYVPETPVVLPLFAIACGLPFAYCGVAALLNRTVIRLDDSELTLRHVPLPWPGNRSFPRKEVRRVCFDARSAIVSGSVIYCYSVLLVTDEGKTVVLLQIMHDRDVALFIVQQLQEWLRVRPDQVAPNRISPPSDAVWRETDVGRA
jgi:hypothetical protein